MEFGTGRGTTSVHKKEETYDQSHLFGVGGPVCCDIEAADVYLVQCGHVTLWYDHLQPPMRLQGSMSHTLASCLMIRHLHCWASPEISMATQMSWKDGIKGHAKQSIENLPTLHGRAQPAPE